MTITPGPLGILLMDAVIDRIPGDIGHPATFPFPILYETVAGASLSRLITHMDPTLVPLFAAAGQRLIARGAQAITTSCGFMICFQKDLAEALPAPVWSSSLLQLPGLLQALPAAAQIGVLTAHAGGLTQRHLHSAGADLARICVAGLESCPWFTRAIFQGQRPLQVDRVQQEVVATARGLVASNPAIRALVLECTNLPPYAAAIRQATGLPVFDITTLLRQVGAAMNPVRYAAPG